jgi:hypothetical protein
MTAMDNFEPPAMYPVAKSEHFETERLLVRRIIEDDLVSLIPVLEDPDLAKWFGRNEPFDPQVFVNGAVAGWEAQGSWAFTIIEKASEHVVGYAGISLELRGGGGRGWQAEPVIAIAPDSQGQGYAYDTMPGLIGSNIGIIKDLGEQEVRVKHTGPGEPRTRVAHVFGITREEYGQDLSSYSPA